MKVTLYVFIVATIINLFCSINIHYILAREIEVFQFYSLFHIIKSLFTNKIHLAIFMLFETLITLICVYIYISQEKPYQSKLVEITPDIHIPESAGQGQHGTARFATKEEVEDYFDVLKIEYNSPIVKSLEINAENELKNVAIILKKEIDDTNFEFDKMYPGKALKLKEVVANIDESKETSLENIKLEQVEVSEKLNVKCGTVLGLNKTKSGDDVLCIDTDTHTLVIGATRSGKTRTEVLQTIGTLGYSGESMILSDPKGELHNYTKPYLESLGYNVIALDFKDPYKSARYNFLQPIIDAIDNNDVDLAQKCATEVAELIVAESNSEPLWRNGELAVITASILSVVYDNRQPKRRKYQNLTNVYYFINEMCKPIEGELPLTLYIDNMEKNHPARGLISAQEVAPFRTRASFNISALTTLKLFPLKETYQMTNTTDFKITDIGDKKTAVFIILPDYTKTYYPLASLFISQVYTDLIKVADLRGSRLKRRVNCILDEFGNFTKIKDFDTKLTVGGGRGIRFTLILQGFSQLNEIYGDNGAKTIKGNCETWIYLQSDDNDTLKELSGKLDNYTVSTYSLSSSHQKFTQASHSQSVNLTHRELLKPNEIARIKRPYSLVTSRTYPTMAYCPDLSQWKFNELFGMGDEEHNRALIFARSKMRVERDKIDEMKLWGIWTLYQDELKIKQAENKK